MQVCVATAGVGPSGGCRTGNAGGGRAIGAVSDAARHSGNAAVPSFTSAGNGIAQENTGTGAEHNVRGSGAAANRSELEPDDTDGAWVSPLSGSGNRGREAPVPRSGKGTEAALFMQAKVTAEQAQRNEAWRLSTSGA